MAQKFKNHYNQIGKKEDFRIKYDAEDLTDQSQIVSASITEMARRYGIDAIIAKAKQLNVEQGQLQDKLYGNDFTQMINSREELLNVKKKLNNVFENIPAIIRKEHFGDNIMNFINAYTSNDEVKLGKLAEIGLVSDKQLQDVKTYNAAKRTQAEEAIKRQQFITELEKQQGALYEKFKETGTININIPEINTGNIPSVPTNLS